MLEDRAAQLLELAKSVGRQLANNKGVSLEKDEDNAEDERPKPVPTRGFPARSS